MSLITFYSACTFQLNFSSDTRIRDKADASIAQRVPGIKQLAKRYNTLCVELAQNKHVIALGVPLPQPVDVAELFNVDANPDLWRGDVLINGSSISDNYMSSDSIKLGIPAMLAKDRYEEEEYRLQQELAIMVQWVSSSLSNTDDAITHCKGMFSDERKVQG